MYQTYWRVAVGQLRQQIELNKELVRLYIDDQNSAWSTTLIHVPEREQKETFTCRKGCCKFQLQVVK